MERAHAIARTHSQTPKCTHTRGTCNTPAWSFELRGEYCAVDFPLLMRVAALVFKVAAPFRNLICVMVVNALRHVLITYMSSHIPITGGIGGLSVAGLHCPQVLHLQVGSLITPSNEVHSSSARVRLSGVEGRNRQPTKTVQQCIGPR